MCSMFLNNWAKINNVLFYVVKKNIEITSLQSVIYTFFLTT
jgi:hypothetical protein